jgi:hypothetical protein
MLVAAAACEGERTGDGANDSFLVGEKTDMGGVSEGSAEACGVLGLANEATLDVLDFTVRLDSRAAANIVAYRAGADALAGTADGVFERKDNSERLREIPIGDLLADALRVTYGADLGFMNGGGIRAPLPSTYMPADHALRRPDAGYAAGPPYDLVVGDAYAILP